MAGNSNEFGYRRMPTAKVFTKNFITLIFSGLCVFAKAFALLLIFQTGLWAASPHTLPDSFTPPSQILLAQEQRQLIPQILSDLDAALLKLDASEDLNMFWRKFRVHLNPKELRFAVDDKAAADLFKSTAFVPQKNTASLIYLSSNLLALYDTKPVFVQSMVLNALYFADSWFEDSERFSRRVANDIDSFHLSIDALYVQSQYCLSQKDRIENDAAAYFLQASLSEDKLAWASMIVLGLDVTLLQDLEYLGAALGHDLEAGIWYERILGLLDLMSSNIQKALGATVPGLDRSLTNTDDAIKKAVFASGTSALTLLRHGLLIINAQIMSDASLQDKEFTDLQKQIDTKLKLLEAQARPLAEELGRYRASYLQNLFY